MLKRFLLPLLLLPLLFAGCRCHREQVVLNATPQFDNEVVWRLASIRGKAVNYEEGQKAITLQLNPEACTFSGCSGCNQYFGAYTSTPEGTLALSEINGTKMACPEPWMRLERQYMQALNKADHYRLGEYQLELLQGETVILSFDKTSK
ncbi:MAG: META domain-containing protein [Bacteroidales bacterium]|nr:META domain-containing protein [Bacteroidales bacterium]